MRMLLHIIFLSSLFHTVQSNSDQNNAIVTIKKPSSADNTQPNTDNNKSHQTPRPKLTVMIVVDQLGDIYIKKIQDYLRYGLKKLLTKSIYYTSAYHPHGMPSTATGHAALSTGAFAQCHGIVGNKWISADGKKVNCDHDSAPNAAIYNAVDGTLLDKGASSHFCMVDGLSDQFVLAGSDETPHKAYAISLKSRAPLLTGGVMGKAIWFDQKRGLYTTNKKSFDAFPDWLADFNAKHDLSKQEFVHWTLMYPKNHAAYKHTSTKTYAFTHQRYPRVNTQVPIRKTSTAAYKEGDMFSAYQTTPQANQSLLDLGKKCLEEVLNPNDPDRMILWLCLSPLDKLGHDFGPDSMETADLLYWLDKQLKDFIAWTQKRYGKEDVLFCLTGDHGICPIVEVAYNKGFTLAHRFYVPTMLKSANELINNKFGIEKIVAGFKCPQIYLDHKKLDKLDEESRSNIEQELITFVKKLPGVKDAWSFKTLKNGSFHQFSPEYYLQQQLFEGRSGDITLLTYPYSMVTKWEQGADHRSPYQFNLHVPICLYWPGHLKAQKINERVLTLQLPKTVAMLNHVDAPSACIQPDLPCISNTNV